MDYLQPDFYRFSEDSLVLSQRVIEREQGMQTCLELGSGCGVVGIEVANKIASIRKLVLLEKQKAFFPFLEQNTQTFLRPNISCEILQASFEEYTRNTSEKFDIILGNLPYFLPTTGRLGTNQNRNICRHWIEGSFNDVLTILDKNLKDNGRAYLITNQSLIQNISGYTVHHLDQFKSARLILVGKVK